MEISSIRRLAARFGYRLQKARKIKWEGTGWTPAFRLIDRDTGWAVWPGFDDLSEVENWLR